MLMEPVIVMHKVILRVKDIMGNMLVYKVFNTQRLQVMMDNYCNHHKIARNDCKFMYDGTVIKNYHTPAMLEMEDGDAIDFVLHKHE